MSTMQNFYRTDTCFPHPRLDNFPQDISIPELSHNHRGLLDKPITAGEVLRVIKSLKTGSAPGPDGLSVCCYKKFGQSLTPYLVSFLIPSVMEPTLMGTLP